MSEPIATDNSSKSRIFIELGGRFDQVFDQFSSQVIQKIIPELLEILAPALLLYFIVKGWMIMSGRSRDAFSDLIVQVGIMSFLIAIGLSTTQTFRYAHEAFNAVQSILLGGLPTIGEDGTIGNTTTPLTAQTTWVWLQKLWNYMYYGLVEAAEQVLKTLAWYNFGHQILVALLVIVGVLACAYFIFQISTIFILNKVVITLLIAFSPIFFALGVFPPTRDYLQNWLKTAAVYILGLVLVLAVGWMFSSIYMFYVKDIYDLIEGSKSKKGGLIFAFAEVVVAIIMMMFILSYVIKIVPSIAQSLIGKLVSATAFTPGSTVANDVFNTAKQIKDSFTPTPSESKSDGKQTDQKAQNIADQANSGGSAGLKKAASLAGGGRKGGKGQSGGKQRAQSANNHSKSNGFTQAAPLSAFAKGRGGSAQFSSNGANSGPAQSIPVRGDSSLSAGAGSSASKASGNSGASASYSAPASASQFSPNTANPKTSMTSNGGDKAMGASGSVSGYDLNAGSGTNLSQSAPVKAANLASAPSSPNGDASNGSPSGSTPSAPSDATKAANAATPIQASGGSIYSTKSAQAAQQAKAPGQGGIQSDGLGSATIQNNGLQQLKKAQRQSHVVNAANQAGQTPKKR